ncbi:hypothetical protein D515_00089 [Grimontia indica]|uniref:Uncharacterized protein n=1 Tax=Grimontia indica TaxID=1056512 RepID=R1IMN8_9GAMM|nr:hypothetical protein [Grimontia indica]EOD81931.1 hypothetical protein D515_00089 [Grimontia indica]
MKLTAIQIIPAIPSYGFLLWHIGKLLFKLLSPAATLAYQRWIRSFYLHTLRTLPTPMYVIAAISAFVAWAIFGIYGEELVKSATMTFLAGSATSVFAAVIFYYFTNHITDINNRKSAYEAHYYELLRISSPCGIEAQFFGWKHDENTAEKAKEYCNPSRSLDGLSEQYIRFLEGTGRTSTPTLLNEFRTTMSRIDRSVVFFDQDVRNAFALVERRVDELLVNCGDFEIEAKQIKDETHRHNLMVFNEHRVFTHWLLKTKAEKIKSDPTGYVQLAEYRLSGFSHTVAIAASLTLARIELRKAMEKHVEPLIPEKMKSA